MLTGDMRVYEDILPLNMPLIMAPTFFPFSAPLVMTVISWRADNSEGSISSNRTFVFSLTYED